MLDEILTADELFFLTEKRIPSAQARVLDHLRIHYQMRPSGTLIVYRRHALGLEQDHKKHNEKTLDVNRIRMINEQKAHA